MYQFYFDLDGVMVDLASSVEQILNVRLHHPRHSTENHPEVHDALCDLYKTNTSIAIFETAPKMSTADDLWTAISKHSTPEILSSTGPMYSIRISEEKRRWVSRHIGEHVTVNLVEQSKLKSRYATPHSILIDDQSASIDPWREAGGIGILHTNLINTLTQVEQILQRGI